MSIMTIVGFEIPLKKRGADMRSKNQEISDAILKFVNKYYHDRKGFQRIRIYIKSDWTEDVKEAKRLFDRIR